ncbi:hypothetical protein Hanom_Chr06g00547231 [Helianthus anomalus]
MTNIIAFYVDQHVVFYIHSFTIVCFMAEIIAFYDFLGNLDFVAKSHPVNIYTNYTILCFFYNELGFYKGICFFFFFA